MDHDMALTPHIFTVTDCDQVCQNQPYEYRKRSPIFHLSFIITICTNKTQMFTTNAEFNRLSYNLQKWDTTHSCIQNLRYWQKYNSV